MELLQSLLIGKERSLPIFCGDYPSSSLSLHRLGDIEQEGW